MKQNSRTCVKRTLKYMFYLKLKKKKFVGPGRIFKNILYRETSIRVPKPFPFIYHFDSKKYPFYIPRGWGGDLMVVHWTPDREVGVQAQPGVTVLCYWARCFTLTVIS